MSGSASDTASGSLCGRGGRAACHTHGNETLHSLHAPPQLRRMAADGGESIDRAQAVVDDQRDLLIYHHEVRRAARMEELLPLELRCSRGNWEAHSRWHSFLDAELGFSGWPLTAHRSFRQTSQEIVEMCLHVQLLLPRCSARRPPTLRLRMGTIEQHWRQWMAAMQGGHARFEERRLFKMLAAQWPRLQPIGHLSEEHRELEHCEHAVGEALQTAMTSATPEKTWTRR